MTENDPARARATAYGFLAGSLPALVVNALLVPPFVLVTWGTLAFVTVPLSVLMTLWQGLSAARSAWEGRRYPAGAGILGVAAYLTVLLCLAYVSAHPELGGQTQPDDQRYRHLWLLASAYLTVPAAVFGAGTLCGVLVGMRFERATFPRWAAISGGLLTPVAAWAVVLLWRWASILPVGDDYGAPGVPTYPFSVWLVVYLGAVAVILFLVALGVRIVADIRTVASDDSGAERGEANAPDRDL